MEIAQLGEGGHARRENELGANAMAGRGRAEEIGQGHAAFQILRRHPALGILDGELAADGHPVGQEFAHGDCGATDLPFRAPVFDRVERHRVVTGWRFLARAMGEFLEPGRAQLEALAFHLHATRVVDHQLERQTHEVLIEIAAAHQGTDMDLVARPVEATLGEEIGGEALVALGFRHAAHVEAAHVEEAILAAVGQVGRVAPRGDLEQGGRLFLAQVAQRGQVRVPFPVGVLAEHRLAVAADDLHARAGHRLAGLDRLHEHVVGAVGRLLGEDAQVRHHDQARVRLAHDLLRLGVPALHLDEEEAAPLT